MPEPQDMTVVAPEGAAVELRDAEGAINAEFVDKVVEAIYASDAATLRDARADLPDVTCSRTLVNCGGTCVAVCATPSPAPTQLSCAAPGTPGCGMAAIAGGTFDMGGDTMAANSTPGQPMMSVSS